MLSMPYFDWLRVVTWFALCGGLIVFTVVMVNRPAKHGRVDTFENPICVRHVFILFISY